MESTMPSAPTAEDAVQRARMIAARLSGASAVLSGPVSTNGPDRSNSTEDNDDTVENGSNNGAASNKRKRWGVMPEESDSRPRLASWLATHAPSVSAVPAAVIEAPVTRRVWVAGVTDDKPAAHFVAFAKDRLAAIAEEHNSSLEVGEKQGDNHDAATREDEDKANDDPNRLQIRFQGKGADSSAPPLPGMPEEPLHVAIVGRKVDVERVVPLVDDILTQAQKAETDVAAVQAAAAAREQALVLLTTSAAASLQSHSYRPASVAAMIGNVAAVNSSLPADRLAAALLHGTTGGAGGGATVTEEVRVPNSVVGCIIGRGGETIASLQATTGCKVQIQKEHEIQPGQVDRIITLSASSSASVAECRRIIEDMVQERSKPLPSAASNKQTTDTMAAVQAGHKLLEMQVPDADVGLVIGKMGCTCMLAARCLP
jgi:far upstream element-binding protein